MELQGHLMPTSIIAIVVLRRTHLIQWDFTFHCELELILDRTTSFYRIDECIGKQSKMTLFPPAHILRLQILNSHSEICLENFWSADHVYAYKQLLDRYTPEGKNIS